MQNAIHQVRRLVAAAVLAMAAAFSIAGAVHAADMHVKIDNFTFNPPKLTVPPGTTVIWDNQDDIPHTVAASGKTFKSKALDTGDSFSFAFTTAGTYEYFCSLHPHMTGTIVVQVADARQPAR